MIQAMIGAFFVDFQTIAFFVEAFQAVAFWAMAVAFWAMGVDFRAMGVAFWAMAVAFWAFL